MITRLIELSRSGAIIPGAFYAYLAGLKLPGKVSVVRGDERITLRVTITNTSTKKISLKVGQLIPFYLAEDGQPLFSFPVMADTDIGPSASIMAEEEWP